MKTISLLALLIFTGKSLFAVPSNNSEYLDSFSPANGFKPAQQNLTEIYLQLAGSLEYYGSPVPYFRHVQAEQARIAAKYKEHFGKEPNTYLPAFMDAAYVNRLAAIWEKLSPKLGLSPYAKDAGNMMRDAIKGTRGTGTILVEIFNNHQSKVFDYLAGKGSPVGFANLKSTLITELELNKSVVNEDRYELPRRDAISFALGIHGITIRLFEKLDAALPPADAKTLKSTITGFILDVGEAADAELHEGLAEWALDKEAVSAR